MATVCIGCGLKTDSSGKLIVDMTDLGIDRASVTARETVAATNIPAAGADVLVQKMETTITNRSDCVTKKLLIAYTSDIPMNIGDDTRIQKIVEHSTDSGATWGQTIGPIHHWLGAQFGGPTGSFASWYDTNIPFGVLDLAPGASQKVAVRTRLLTISDAGNGGQWTNPAMALECYAYPYS